jgi:CRISPR-associated protein Csb2
VGTVHGSAGTPAPAGTSAHVRWLPVATTGGNALRHPVAGTLDALVARHVAFLSRLPNDAATGEKFFRPVPPLATFRTVTYRPETDLASPPCAVFALRRPDDSAFATFDPQRRRLHLAGMLRHAAAVAADELGWNTEKKNAVVLGHAPADAPTDAPSPLPTVHGGTATGITGVTATRLIFIPLPSIEWRGDGNRVGAIRRVLVTTTGDAFPLADFDALVRALEGRDLRDEYYKNTVAFLRRDRSAENYAAGGAVSRYFAEAATWTTVTPLVLPGHDDRRGNRKKLRTLDAAAGKIRPEQKYAILRRLDAYIEHLLRRALRQSGIPENLADAAEIEWRGTGWLAGTGLASDYFPPDHLRRFRRLHVRLTWRDPAGNPLLLRGPFCLGAGRHFGLGLFAPAAVPPPPAPPATKRHFSSHSIA